MAQSSGFYIVTPTIPPPEPLLGLKMFENQTGDWEMVSSDGTTFKFHQSLLGEQFEFFRELSSNPDSVECKTKRVVVPLEVDMSGPALEAFLRYFYGKDTSRMESSFSIMCALIRTGHFYNIAEIIIVVANKIHAFSSDPGKYTKWFTVRESWKLYQHVWSWEETHPCKYALMDNIIDVLQTFAEVKEQHYDELLVITDEKPDLRDLIVAFAKRPPKSLPRGGEERVPNAAPAPIPWRNFNPNVRPRRGQPPI